LAVFQLFWPFLIFEKKPLGFSWPFLATYLFYVDLADLKMSLAGFWALADFQTVFLDTMIRFHWKLCTRIYDFLFLLLHAYKSAVSSYSSAKPNVSRSSLME